MREKPILFSGPMVMAILEGRKTHTRRVVKDASGAFWDHKGWVIEPSNDGLWRFFPKGDRSNLPDFWSPEIKCPYGQPGDQLWVRETYCALRDSSKQCSPIEASYVLYQLDGAQKFKSDGVIYSGHAHYDKNGEGCSHVRWRPSIHMPRWASRITLEITGIRVERLNEISEEDAKSEGAEWVPIADNGQGCHRAGFCELWDRISLDRGFGWDANPWVWVIEFKRVQP